MSDTRRLFFALWPDERVRRQLDTIARQYRPAKSRAIPRPNLHATLIFLGSMPEILLPVIVQAGASIEPRALTLTLQQLQVWRKPQVLCLCPESIPAALQQLHDELAVALHRHEIPFDERSYRPHVTLARKVRQRVAVNQLPEAIDWSVSGFSLVESVSMERGVQYVPLHQWQQG